MIMEFVRVVVGTTARQGSEERLCVNHRCYSRVVLALIMEAQRGGRQVRDACRLVLMVCANIRRSEDALRSVSRQMKSMVGKR